MHIDAKLRQPVARTQLAGFSLIEMLVAIAVAGILLALAIPSYTSSIANNRQSSLVNSFVNALGYARSHALTQNVNVQVCPFSAAGSITCGGSWATGWIIVTVPATGTGVLLQSHQAGPREPTLSSQTATTAVSFDTRGLAATTSNFQFCDSRGATFARSLEVIATGSVVVGPTPGTAIWGGSITCS